MFEGVLLASTKANLLFVELMIFICLAV